MNGVHPPWTWLAWGAALLVSACAPPSPPAAGGAPVPAVVAPQASLAVAEAMPRAAGRCDAAPAQGAVGQAASPAVAETARQQAGARSVRVIGHDEVVTKEYDTSRLNLQLDARGMVVRVYCG
ncbi:MAG: hypothetical protein RIS88_1445 [Pseudomonadota bacterium]